MKINYRHPLAVFFYFLANCIYITILYSAFPAKVFGENRDPLAELRKQAEAGDTIAQVRLGLCYEHGKGVDTDHEESVRWLQKAAEKDNPDALLLLGINYSTGQGVPKDKQKALELLKKAAMQGHPMAMGVYGEILISEGELATGTAFHHVGTFRLLETDPATGLKSFNDTQTYQQQLPKDQAEISRQIAEDLENKLPYIETLLGYTFPLGPANFTQTDLDAIVKEILPEVEKAAGKTFKSPPTVLVSTRFTTAMSLAEDLLPQLRKLYPHQPDELTRQMALQQAFITVQSVLGKYGFHDKKLYLVPRNLSLAMEKLGMPASLTPNLVKVLLAHEMTHALQDQYLNLPETLAGMTDEEALSAFNAVIEGHAVFVQDSLGTALGLDREVMECARFLSAGIDPKTAAAGDQSQIYALRYFQEVYLGGRAFIDAICQLHGRGKLWDVLEHPPLRTSVILFPETYTFGNQKQRLDLSPILMGMENRFGGGPWQVQHGDVDTMKIKALYGSMPPQKLNELLPKFIAVHALSFGHPKAGNSNGLSIFFMRDQQSVRDLIDALEIMARNNIKQISASGKLIVKDIQFRDFPVNGAEIARKISFRTGTNEDNLSNCAMYRVGFRSIMVEIEDNHLNLDDPQAAEIAIEVRDRFVELRRKQAIAAGKTINTASNDKAGTKTALPASTSPFNADNILKEATNHFNRKDYTAARNSLQQLLNKSPNHARARLMMAVMAAREKKYDEAWQHIEIARRAAPNDEKIDGFIKQLQKASPR